MNQYKAAVCCIVFILGHSVVAAMQVFTAYDSVEHTRKKSYSSSANQDVAATYSFRLRDVDCTLLSVCDGYGDLGEQIAAMVNSRFGAVLSGFAPVLAEAVAYDGYEDVIRRAYRVAQEQVELFIDDRPGEFVYGGTTSTGAIIIPDSEKAVVVLHNVGDSRTALFSGTDLVKITAEHKADPDSCPEEVNRVLGAGGIVRQQWADRTRENACWYEEQVVKQDDDDSWLVRWVYFDEDCIQGRDVDGDELSEVGRKIQEGLLQPNGMRVEHLLMTRVLGECREFRERFMMDREEGPIVSCEPEISVLPLEHNPEGHTVISGSDGFWDMICDKDIVEAINRLRVKDGKRFARNLCSHLIMLAKQRSRKECNSKIHDDITLAVAYIW